MSPPGDLEPIPRESTAALIANRLRSAIMYGSLAPGDQLGEAELAGRLGVSRGPLREAMQRLVQEGLLRSERHRGLFVIELTPDDVHDIYTARLAVERCACERIMRSEREETLACLTEALRRLEEAARTGDRTAMSEADQTFHQTLVSASGNSRLERMAQTLLVETRMCLNAMQRVYPEPEELVEEHRKLVDAIADGDEDLLLRRIEAHLMDTVARINRHPPDEHAHPPEEEGTTAADPAAEGRQAGR